MSLAWDVRAASGTETLPGGWTVRRIGDLVTLVNGHPFPSESFGPNGDVPLVRIRDLAELSFETYVTGHVPPSALLRNGDVVIGMDGDFNLVVWDRGEAALNQRLCLLRPRTQVDMRFIAYALPSSLKIINDLTFATTVKHLSSTDVLSERIMLPPLDEQRRIADFLAAETGRIDSLRELRTTQVALLGERLTHRWSTVIAQDGKDAGWVPIRRFVTAITDGPFGSALTSAHYSDAGARVIRLGNLGRAEFRDHDAAYVPLDYFDELKRHEALPGDLVVAGLGDQNHPLGRACVVPEHIGPAMVKADCFRLRLDQSRVLHDYAAWALSSPPVNDQVALLSRGSTRARINLEAVREIPVPAPSLKRQRRSMAILDEERRVIQMASQRCHSQLDLLAERRQALITAAVTGRFDVTTASGRNATEGISV
ncbi:restriction endonuclease subunit S [Streptomyces caelestis]|uniref:Type I restriction enzyme S subunit n=1 Tax=Streptomyces caelestis TaxID=36816 RepID=A0A7W9LWQ8_9ACTN|nr:restriction endonuclease subunit S [Streptomyces caelestis]MBB5798941.1 type I restriction enzyme S subunit [Streptomyces caelestis]GGW48279.1 type I restriction-modification protein subunit S [Streptomyces caelestis]